MPTAMCSELSAVVSRFRGAATLKPPSLCRFRVAVSRHVPQWRVHVNAP